MPLIDTNHQRAALLVLLLGLGLVIALTPYATGLIGIPVLYAVFAPVHAWLSLRARPKVAASLVVVLALFLIVVPGVSFAGLIVNQAQQITGSVVKNPILGRIAQLELGGVDIGPRIADLGAKIVGWLGSSAFGLIGTATRLALNLTISLFGFLPIVGSGLVWVPAAIALLISNRPGPAALITLVGLFVGNVDYILRPMVFRRWANIHPLVTLVGALAGVPYFGILGLLIGPLALSYFFELVKMYREEYLG